MSPKLKEEGVCATTFQDTVSHFKGFFQVLALQFGRENQIKY